MIVHQRQCPGAFAGQGGIDLPVGLLQIETFDLRPYNVVARLVENPVTDRATGFASDKIASGA